MRQYTCSGTAGEVGEWISEGYHCRGGFEVAMDWTNGTLHEATFISQLGGNLRIRSYVPLEGKGLKPASGENPNPVFKRKK